MDATDLTLEAVLEALPDALFVVDRAGTILQVNALGAELFGYAKAELIGRSVQMLVPDSMQGLFEQDRDRFAAKPQRRAIALPPRLNGLHKSKGEMSIEVRLNPVGKGEEMKVLCSVRDISERVTAEDVLRRSLDELERRARSADTVARGTQDHFKLFLKHAPVGIALLDRQLRYLIVSDRWLQDYGLGERDVHGLCHYDVVPHIPERWREQYRRCLTGEVIRNEEDRFEQPDGRVEWVRRELHPWRTGDGKIGGILIFGELITARKNAELALLKNKQDLEQRVAERTAALEEMKDDADRANAQKSWFVAAASHDLRQPLQASLAYLSVLARKTGQPELEELCLKARQPLKAMSDILDVLLDISDLESGHVKPHRQDFSLHGLITRVIANAQHQASEKGLRLSFLPTPFTAHSDPKLLERILSNFVTNAIRYTDRGLIGVYCEQMGDCICVSVTDTGIGIPADAIDSIFEDHVQLGNPARDRRKGLGLGLSIAKRIADSLGHRISVHSELGSGSSFSIELPIAESQARITNAPAPEPVVKSDGRRPVVLMIDDDPDVADAMQMLLQSYDFETYMAQGRDPAIAMLESGLTPGLILCDYRLPGTNGIDVIRQLRRALNADVPAVLMTGDMGLTACPDDLPNAALLHKPVDVDKLFATLDILTV